MFDQYGASQEHADQFSGNEGPFPRGSFDPNEILNSIFRNFEDDVFSRFSSNIGRQEPNVCTPFILDTGRA